MAVVSLTEQEYIRVSGPDNKEFLQGQLSCNVDALSPSRSLIAALCNLKGRVIADLRLLQQGEDCLLQTAPGLADPVLQILGKYAVFSKVELTRAELAGPALGLIDENSQELAEQFGGIPEEFHGVVQNPDLALIRIPGCSLRFELWCFSEAGREQASHCLANGEAAPLSSWQREDLRAGIIHVSLQMSEQYTPQLLNYDISGVIDFKKGCYTGQEVVARMYYRGNPKQRLYLLNSPSPLQDDSELQQSLEDKTRQGEILAWNNGDGDANFLLAILDTAMVTADASFSLKENAEEKLQLLPLPYVEERD